MKHFTKYGALEDTVYSQVNNPSEEQIRKDDIEDRAKITAFLRDAKISEAIISKAMQAMGGYLETCGPTAATMGVHAIGKLGTFECPGFYSPQPEQIAADWFNDPRNYAMMRKIRPETDPAAWAGNRIPQFYPAMIKDVFGVTAIFAWDKSYEYISKWILENFSFLACFKESMLKKVPGHFFTVVGFDDQTGNIIYNDPWPGNYYPARYLETSAMNRELTQAEWQENVEGYTVRIG